MSDVISQAPAEPITQQDEVAENATPEVSTQEQPQTEQPPTLEAYRQIAREEATRVAQSQVAKSENRTNQRIAERFAALEANKGILKLTEDQVQTAKREIINEEQMAAFTPQESQASTPGQAPSNDSADFGQFVYDQIDKTFELIGTPVTTQDKEWAMIQKELDDPMGSIAKTQLAAIDASRAKATRLAEQKAKAPARVINTGSGSTNQQPKTLSAEDKISQGLKTSTWPSQEPKRT
jgi:hypothetical protein